LLWFWRSTPADLAFMNSKYSSWSAQGSQSDVWAAR
jgi:hypothetical protein